MSQTMEMKDQIVETVETIETERTESEISEEEETFFQDINLLVDQGISVADVKTLQKAGINTIKGVQMTMGKKLQALGFDEAKLVKILEACTKLSLDMCFMTAAKLSVQRKQIFKLSTGSKELDKLLNGGIEAMAITEVFGEFGTGKTQLAHTLCVTAQMPGQNGYIGGKVIFIDTEHTFRPDRLRAIADRFNLDQATVLENILYARAYNSDHQFQMLNSVAAKLHEEPGIFKLLIVDSIMALFRVDYYGISEIADRQMKLGQMLSRLQKISEEYNIVVFMTNQITSDFTPQIMNSSKPVGGNVLAHASTSRICFTKGSGPIRKATVIDSPDLEANFEAQFIITNGGIDDLVS